LLAHFAYLFVGMMSCVSIVSAHQKTDGPKADSPKIVTAASLLHRLTRTELEAMIGKKSLIDSGFVPDGKSALRMYAYVPVNFEGQMSRLRATFANDTVKVFTLTIPRRGKATGDDFSKLSSTLSKEIGEPSVTTNNYIDYLLDGAQPLFGVLKDGVITITITPIVAKSGKAK
jgi:hypothetical protein